MRGLTRWHTIFIPVAKVLFLDCISGLSGDMFLSGLVDLGLSPRALEAAIRKSGIGPFRMRFETVLQKSIRARRLDLKFRVRKDTAHPHGRSWREIERMIRSSKLDSEIKALALKIFGHLAEAEGKVHGVPAAKVHFHEVGALDSIFDIVGAAVGVHELGIGRVLVSPLPLGSGFVQTEHGMFPVPGPATLELLKGFPTCPHPEVGELVTPTGAAIVRALAEPVRSFPAMSVGRVGYGAGTRTGVHVPNVVRMVLGEDDRVKTGAVLRDRGALFDRDEVWLLETNLDDMTPEWVAPVIDRLLAAGALDVHLMHTQMKRGRPGFCLRVLAPPALRERLVERLFEETTTIGIRTYKVERFKLPRRMEKIRTPYGWIRVKISTLDGRVSSAKPEMADVLRAARRAGEPARRVLREIEQLVARRVRPG